VILSCSIDPVRSLCVSFYLERLDEVGRSPTVLDDICNFCPGHGVPLEGGRVVDVVDPDLTEHMVCLDRSWETSQRATQEGDFFVESTEDLLERWTACSPRFPTLMITHGCRVAKSHTLLVADRDGMPNV